MSQRTLRILSLQLTTLAFEVAWLSALSVAVALHAANGALPWLVLYLAGVVLFLGNYWLWRRDLWVTWAGRMASGVLAFMVIWGLMQIRAPEEAGWVVGPMDWGRAIWGLVSLNEKSMPLSLILAVGIVLLFRVMQIIGRPLGLWEVAFRLRLGMVLLVVAIVVSDYREAVLSRATILVFLTSGLIAFALARVTQLSYLKGVSSPPTNRRWLMQLFGTIGLVFLSGSLLTYFLQPGGMIRTILEVLFRGLVTVLAPVMLTLLWLLALAAEAFAYLFWFVIGRILETLEFTPADPNQPNEQLQQWLEEMREVPSPNGTWIAAFLLIISIMMLLFYLNRLFVRRKMRPPSEFEPETDYEAVSAAGSLSRWMESRRKALEALLKRFTRSRPQFGVETVRDLYKNLLLFGDDHGLARPARETPYEYLLPLCEHYPQHCQDFHALTNAYVAVHYGERHFSRTEIETLQASWEQIATIEKAPA